MSREVRVIGDEGKQLGVMPTHIACRIAEEKGLDLVEVNPKAEPPVCKIIDYGRFKYEESKKKQASKKKQTVVQIKEIKLRPKTDTHDRNVKIRAIMRFLAEGNKAKLVIQFRGREIVHPETGKAVLHKVLTELGDLAVVEQWPVMEGRRMNMMVAPRPGATFPAAVSATKSSENAATKSPESTQPSAPDKEDDTPQGESESPSPPAAAS
jgi:translation initiation factor IF-3